jgi:hypothetical protein
MFNKLYNPNKWYTPLQFPKELAREFYIITAVRVEKLQDITFEQIIKEGIDFNCGGNCGKCPVLYPCNFKKIACKDGFENLWNKLTPKKDLDEYGWCANPWVWVYEWERVSIND